MDLLEIKIDKAAISLTLWEGRLNAMSEALSSPDYIYENSGIDQKRQLIIYFLGGQWYGMINALRIYLLVVPG